MWDISRHDYAHCQQGLCQQRHECLRYQLFKEDLKYTTKTHQPTYCTYLRISSEESKTCTAFISKRLT